MELDRKERVCANYWDSTTQTERYALLNGCLGVGGMFYERSKLVWAVLPLELRVELLVLDWEGMLGKKIPGFTN